MNAKGDRGEEEAGRTTGRCWPSRWIRSMAWYSTAGFHQESHMMTREAVVRLSATPPALSEMRKTVTSIESLKRSIVACRASIVIPPSSRQTCTKRNVGTGQLVPMRGKGEREGKGTNLEACPLQPKRDDVQKADELGKDERLRGNVLCSESVELLNESFELGRGFPFLNAASKRQEKGRIASASFRERLDSAIGRRDRPGKVRTETLSRPRIPCLAILTFSGSCSTASASQSMVMEQLQTGQGAYDKSGTSLSA
jgi:hypothetical protein